jgi:uncharacterized protein
MLRALCYGLLIPIRFPVRSISSSSIQSASLITRYMSMSSMSGTTVQVDPLLLAQAWSKPLMAQETGQRAQHAQIVKAAARSIPLLEDVSSVPFVCRYRTDVIAPLTTRQVHYLFHLQQKHAALASQRNRLLQVLGNNNGDIQRRVLTSTSKSELEDLYAPYKPPSKGSILERMQKEHPALVEQVDALWNTMTNKAGQQQDQKKRASIESLKPHEALVHLLSTKIAGEPRIVDLVMDELEKHCRVKTTATLVNDKTTTTATTAKKNINDKIKTDEKYNNYKDFTGHLNHLKDHQVLAIRRGVNQKALKMGYEMDGTKMESSIQYNLHKYILIASGGNRNPKLKGILEESIHDAWIRVLRRKGTARLWGHKCKMAEERAMQVFEQNLYDALLAPPRHPACFILAMDPGFQAGIKCAVLDPMGKVVSLETVQYLGNNKSERAVEQLAGMLSSIRQQQQSSGSTSSTDEKVVVALGNGKGTREARALVEQAAAKAAAGTTIPIEIQLVSEAGASVWSVTEAAKEEFPKEQPAGIASISIGRRLQNPLHELIKVPPRSLGLGMYQHDLSEKELDGKLHLTSVDAVATVGVDVNTCNLEILQKVPGLTKLATKIVKARPLRQRKDLLNVSGLGPKTFESCAAFCRVAGSGEALDATLVHPESYELARWLLKTFGWKVSEAPKDVVPKNERATRWESTLRKASDKFGVSEERVLAVLENLIDSMTQMDPRLREQTGVNPISNKAGSVDGCVLLSPELDDLLALQKVTPVRGIIGTIRNIADFGAFIDFGGQSDGLLHTSKLGPVKLQSFLIGQQLGVDILDVTNGKVSLGLAGLRLDPSPRGPRGASRPNGANQSRTFSSSSGRTAKGTERPGAKKRSSGSSKDVGSTANKRRKTAR